MNFVEFVGRKAQQCGWKISRIISENMVSISFDTASGSETCFIQPCGKNADGNTVVEFSSAGLEVPANSNTAGALALVLLERNGNMIFGHWGIETSGEEKYFTVFVTMIANTMDVDEFRGAVKAVISERERLFKSLQKSSIDF